ncbi:MAG: hypothetical protein A2284_08260 [Deltaproteobacteria bacterium RIFOXYA12_FULL_61_11]|nr:MAG: hypothetical protein A2284_08260 [Deltaproteobacteria bacterium RIFOXYA12_FULL_61_11]
MDDVSGELIVVLQRQLDHYKHLLALLQEERERMVGMEVERLRVLAGEKEQVIVRLAVLEESRKTLVARLAESFSQESSTFTMTRLAELMAEPLASRVRALQSTMRSLVQTVSELNTLNGGLAGLTLRSLEQSRRSLERHNRTTTYTGKGGLSPRKLTGSVMHMDV